VAMVAPGEGSIAVRWAGKEGVAYQVQYSDDLRTWYDCANGARSGAGSQVYTDEAVRNVRFYRVVTR
jgi:hypothetical protein